MSNGHVTPSDAYTRGYEGAQQIELNKARLAEAGLTLQSEQLSLDQARLMFQRQQAFAEALKHMTGMTDGPAPAPDSGQRGFGGPRQQPAPMGGFSQAAPGMGAPNPQAQGGAGSPITNEANRLGSMSSRMAQNMYSIGELAAESGLPDEALNYFARGEMMERSAIEIQKMAYERQAKGAELMASLIKDIDPNKPGASQEFQQRMMQWSGIMGQQADPRYLDPNFRFTPEIKARMLSAGETLRQQAMDEKDRALTAESGVRKKEGEHRIALIDAERDASRALARARDKAGAFDRAPDPKEMRIITDAAHHDFPDVDIQDLRDRATKHAIPWGREYLAQGVPFATAFQQGYQAAKHHGDFSGLMTGAERAGSSPGKPLTLATIPNPKDKTKRIPDPEKPPREGQWYKSELFPDKDSRLWIDHAFKTQEELESEAEQFGQDLGYKGPYEQVSPDALRETPASGGMGDRDETDEERAERLGTPKPSASDTAPAR